MTTMVTQPAEIQPMPWWLVLLQGIAALIIGIMLIASPVATGAVLVQVLGWYWLISGILSIVYMFMDSTRWGWKLAAGILGILAGMAVIQHPLWSAVLVPTTLIMLLGIQGIIFGAIILFQAFKGDGWGAGIMGAISVLFGGLLLFNPLGGALALPLVLGVLGMAGGVIAIIAAFRMR